MSESVRDHDSHGNPYGTLQLRFNSAEEAIAGKLFGRCILFCGDVACSSGCQSGSGGQERVQ